MLRPDGLLLFSGIASIFVTWILVVFPVLREGIKIKQQTISEIASQNKIIFNSVTTGLILGGTFQLLFAFQVIEELALPRFSLLSILYLSTCLATFLVAFFHERRSPILHAFLVRYYFVTVPVCIFLLGNKILEYNQSISYLSYILSLLYLILNIMIIWRLRKATILSEMLSFGIISLWIVLMTIF